MKQFTINKSEITNYPRSKNIVIFALRKDINILLNKQNIHEIIDNDQLLSISIEPYASYPIYENKKWKSYAFGDKIIEVIEMRGR